jgi:hypothetical protein
MLAHVAANAARRLHGVLVASAAVLARLGRPQPLAILQSRSGFILIRQGCRTRCGIVVESGEPREVQHFCLLLGYGTGANVAGRDGSAADHVGTGHVSETGWPRLM